MGYKAINLRAIERAQVVALARIQLPKTKDQDVSRLMLAWCTMERLRREIKGIPPLAALSLKDAHDIKAMKRALSTPHRAEIIDVPANGETKESLSEPDRHRTAGTPSPQRD